MAGYAYVGGGVTATTTLTINYTATAGNLLLAFTATSGGAGSPYSYVTSCTDTGSGTWKSIFGTINNSNCGINDTGGFYHTGLYQYNCASGITSISIVTQGGTGTPGSANVYVIEYSGIKQSADPLLAAGNAAQTNPGTATNAITTGSISIPSQPCAFISYLGTNDIGSNSLSAGTSPNAFTARIKGNANSGNLQYLTQDIRLTGSGSTSTSATATNSAGATCNSVIMGMAFAELASNTGVTPGVGGATFVGGAAASVSGTVTNITPFVARKGGLIVPDDRIVLPDRKIFLPTFKRAA